MWFSMARNWQIQTGGGQKPPGDSQGGPRQVKQQDHGGTEESKAKEVSVERQRIPKLSSLPNESIPEAWLSGTKRKSVIVAREVKRISPEKVNCPAADISCKDGSVKTGRTE